MNLIPKTIVQNSFFYTLNALLIATITFFLLTVSRADGFIWLNQYHTELLTDLLEKSTFLGDGYFVILLCLSLFFLTKKHRILALFILLSYASSGIFSQILKNIISSPRPSVYFEIHNIQYYLDTFATSRVGFSSFPSGHTASIFALATVIANYFKNNFVNLAVFVMSIIVGYSRIYLSHHFLIDTCFGAFIGLVFGTFSSIWVFQILALPSVKAKIGHLLDTDKTDC